MAEAVFSLMFWGWRKCKKPIFGILLSTVTNFSIDGLGYNNLQGGALRPWEGTNSYYEDPRLASFMGRVNYTYDDRYILTVMPVEMPLPSFVSFRLAVSLSFSHSVF